MTSLRRLYDVSTTTLRRHYDDTTTSLRRLYGDTTTSLLRHYDVSTTTLRRHYDVSTTTLPRHYHVSTTTLRQHYDITTTSLRRQTLRQAGAVVPIQSVSMSTEADVRTIRNFSAEMFASSVSMATGAGRRTNCEDTRTKTTSDQTVVNFHRDVSAHEGLSYLCRSCIRGNEADICRRRSRRGECRSLRSYRETRGSDLPLRTTSRKGNILPPGRTEDQVLK
ncbi:hypothetical protein F2P81_002855 [Scophthalmus maximus]|uniref:Uncharacterized protein n=1 Tax=Scophthalmus maximus TaxID=52904 RepID=A0A6A4TFJ5_SCOMX|nr:hypothetical protein F2P81_002855 [Scophthalmus maximus]